MNSNCLQIEGEEKKDNKKIKIDDIDLSKISFIGGDCTGMQENGFLENKLQSESFKKVLSQ